MFTDGQLDGNLPGVYFILKIKILYYYYPRKSNFSPSVTFGGSKLLKEILEVEYVENGAWDRSRFRASQQKTNLKSHLGYKKREVSYLRALSVFLNLL